MLILYTPNSNRSRTNIAEAGPDKASDAAVIVSASITSSPSL